jgi:hypothetical protein
MKNFRSVQTLAPEILRLQHLGFRFLLAANRAIFAFLRQLYDPTTARSSTLLSRFSFDAGARGRWPRRSALPALLEVDEDVQVIMNQLGGQRHAVAR